MRFNLQIKQQLDILTFLRKSFESKRPRVELTDVKRKITVYTDGKAIIYWHSYFVCPVPTFALNYKITHGQGRGACCSRSLQLSAETWQDILLLCII
jgi:hypothetical protein